ncbi:recombinase family protein [Limosilactobacillus mucosae]|uniref:recombinase family protein n=1 Tax=Limosilactobacillus mucosae TaxID=97478 RepID=UPI0015D54F33|nr:recombinase family protein [Limosilactobacillus mucosae]QLI94415.1 recombinase family protein [Limosilactobacillus mucosae]
MKYGYARVSTESQSLSTQLQLLKQVGIDEIFQEKYTRTTTKRPEFARLLAIVQPNDVIIVTKLDRFARNTGEDLQMIQQLFENQVKINILNMGTIDDTPVGRLIFTVFSAFAQFERDMIVTRTQEGKSYSRRHNPKYHEGRPKVYSDEKIWQAYQLHQKGMTYRELSLRTGISISTLRRRFTLIKSVEIRDHEK